MDKKVIHIIGGGTVNHIANHLALAALAYGKTARQLKELCNERFSNMDVKLHLTRMAGGEALETNHDVEVLLQNISNAPTSKIVFMSAAMCDFYVTHGAGKLGRRFSSCLPPKLTLAQAHKAIRDVRKHRKDIFLVGFKTTTGDTEDEQYIAGLGLLKDASCNLVLANDVVTGINMIITPEEARYHVSQDRADVLKQLVDMTYMRSHLTFTRSTIVGGEPVKWNDERIPESLRAVVNHCIMRGAYKPFKGATVGHFACKLDDTTFLTSIRKSNFNDIDKNGLVLVKTDGPDSVMAYGAKPSVGGQSQRIVFDHHPGYDCIVHFHCPMKDFGCIKTVSQREYECGSHQCGQNTSDGLLQFDSWGGIKAVMLDQHGPNIVFKSSIDPNVVIDFIEAHFELDKKTGGNVKL